MGLELRSINHDLDGVDGQQALSQRLESEGEVKFGRGFAVCDGDLGCGASPDDLRPFDVRQDRQGHVRLTDDCYGERHNFVC